jgi:hypothetical protein
VGGGFEFLGGSVSVLLGGDEEGSVVGQGLLGTVQITFGSGVLGLATI